jgi:hypothetical protein
MLEDGIHLEFSRGTSATLYSDGTLTAVHQGESADLTVIAIKALATSVLAAQGRLDQPAHEAHLVVRVQTSGIVSLAQVRPDHFGEKVAAPMDWTWESEIVVGDAAQAIETLQRSLWRRAGVTTYDPST